MDEILFSTILALSIGIIGGFIAGFLVDAFYNSARRIGFWNNSKRPFRKFWDPLFVNELFIVTASKEKENVSSQKWDFTGLRRAYRQFQKFSLNNFSPVTSDNCSIDQKGSLLLIGGSTPNIVTKKVLKMAMEKYDFTYMFRDVVDPDTEKKDEGLDLINIKTGEVIGPHNTEGRDKKGSTISKISKEYGLIIKCDNPNDDWKSPIILTIGALGWGTAAALEALLIPGNLEFLNKKKEKNFQIVVSVDVFDGVPEKAMMDKKKFEILKTLSKEAKTDTQVPTVNPTATPTSQAQATSTNNS